MTEGIPYRVLVFDDDDSIRNMLWHYFDARGYEVFTFPHPRACPIVTASTCACALNESCADVIISDLNMPFMKGLQFLEQQLSKGCRVKHLALMSGDLTEDDRQRAQSLGITVFKKPFGFQEIDQWVRTAEHAIAPTRQLADWFLRQKQDCRTRDRS